MIGLGSAISKIVITKIETTISLLARLMPRQFLIRRLFERELVFVKDAPQRGRKFRGEEIRKGTDGKIVQN